MHFCYSILDYCNKSKETQNIWKQGADELACLILFPAGFWRIFLANLIFSQKLLVYCVLSS